MPPKQSTDKPKPKSANRIAPANVVRANNMNLFYNGTPTLLYSAKHIGIVRKEFPEYNQVWNLVKYNIVH